MSAFLELRDAVVTALLDGPALAGGFVKAGRAFPLPAETDAGIFVRLARANGAALFAGDLRVDWDTDIVIGMAARAPAGGDGETAVDALVAAVFERLATTAPPAGAEDWAVNPAVAFDVDEADQTLGSAELRLRIKHRTADGSLVADT